MFPPAVADFKAYFNREFIYGGSPSTVMDQDIQKGINQARMVFNQSLWTDSERSIAFYYASAHFMVLDIQAAGGLQAINQGAGVNSKGGGTVESKGVGAVNVGYAVPDFVRQSPILSQFMRTDFGQKYLQLLTPRLVGNMMVLDGSQPELSFAGNISPLSITTLTLSSGTHNVAYLATLQATGGVLPLVWSLASGTLPTGITLGSITGALSGTPTIAGTSYFEITVTDGQNKTSTMNYKLVIA